MTTPAAAPAPAFRMGGVARHAMVYAIGSLLTKAISFLMLPIYTRVLTTTDYGRVALVDMTLDVIGIIGGAQMAYAVWRYYHKGETQADRNAVVSTALGVLAGTYIVLGAITFFAAPSIARLVFGSTENAYLIRIAAGGLATHGLLAIPFSFIQVTDRSTLYVGATIGKLLTQLTLNIVFLVVLELGVAGIFLSTLITNTIFGTALSLWTLQQVGFRFSREATRGMVRYTVPMIGMQLATFVTTFGDRYFLKAHTDEGIVGIYNLSYQFGFLLFVIGFSPFFTIWAPKRFEIAKREDRDAVLSAGFRYGNIVLLSVAVGLSLFVGDIIRLMTTPPFFPAADIVPVILIAYVLLAWVTTQDIGILIKERTEFLTITNWIAAAAALLGWSFLVPRYGAMGAAWASAAAFFVRYLFTYWFSQRLWPVRYQWAPVLRQVAIAVSMAVAVRFLPRMALPASIAVHALMFVVYLGLLWMVGPLSPDDRAQVRAFLASPRATLARAFPQLSAR